jgi:hypothetical protein
MNVNRRIGVVCALAVGANLLVHSAFAAPEFTTISFEITTVKGIPLKAPNELETKTGLTANLYFKEGASATETVTLKAPNAGAWLGGSGHTLALKLPTPRPIEDFVRLELVLNPGQNWQIQVIDAQADLGTCLVKAGAPTGNPAATFTTAQPSFSFFVHFGCPAPPPPPPPPPQTFRSITFNVTTGGDDLRGDSDAKAVAHYKQGTTEPFELKGEGGGSWGNNSNHVVTRNLLVPRPASDFATIDVTLTSHNHVFETDDNWNIQDIAVSVTGPNGSACLFKGSGNPFVRLTGSAGTVTLHPTQGCQ